MEHPYRKFDLQLGFCEIFGKGHCDLQQKLKCYISIDSGRTQGEGPFICVDFRPHFRFANVNKSIRGEKIVEITVQKRLNADWTISLKSSIVREIR
jgi:hypothetical protein